MRVHYSHRRRWLVIRWRRHGKPFAVAGKPWPMIRMYWRLRSPFKRTYTTDEVVELLRARLEKP